MKLFLASHASHPNSMKELDFIVGQKIAYIPTAANGEHQYGSWRTESGTWKMLNNMDVDLTPVILEEIEDVRGILESSDIVWMAGGTCGYLMYWLRRRGVDRYLRDLLDDGLIYIGSSAGSMVAGASLDLAEWYPGEREVGASVIPTLGLVDFNIFPHYREEMTIKESHGEMYLLKDGETIIVEGEEVTFTGEKRVI